MAETQTLARQGDGPPPKLTDEAIVGIVENIKQWEKFKRAALGPKDFTYMGDNQYIEKSGWVKLAMAMNVSFEILNDGQRVEGHDNEGDYYTWKFLGRVTTPKGRYVQMDGACSSRDEFFSMKRDSDGNPMRRLPAEIDEKDIIATAQTNCFNRCMAFLFGFGELSGEEMRGKQFQRKAVTFPFPDEVKGKEPKDCDLATLNKYLATFEKSANDPKNKFREANQKLVAVIKEAIAEKTAKVQSPARQAEESTPPSDPGGQDSAAPPAGEPSAEPSVLEQARIRVQEIKAEKSLTDAMITLWCRKNKMVGYEELDLLGLQALAAYLNGLK